MRIRIEIDGDPLSALLDSCAWGRELDGRIAKAEFTIKVGAEVALSTTYGSGVYDSDVYSGAGGYDEALYGTGTYAQPLPSQQSEVIFYNADTDEKLFRGFIVNIARDIKSATMQFWKCTCVSIETLLESVTVNTEWTAKTPRFIIQAAFGAALPEIATTDATVDDIGDPVDLKAKDMTLKDLLERVSSLAGAEYFITPEKVLVFRLAASVAAPFGFDSNFDGVTTFRYDSIQIERDSVEFANRVVALGGFYGPLGAELTSTADNTASQTALRRVVRASAPARDINNQAALDLFAQIELERRGGVLEHVRIRCHHGSPKAQENVPATLQVGHVVTFRSVNGGTQGEYVVQSLTYKMKTQEWTTIDVQLGDYKRKLSESQRRLEKIRVNPLVPPVPPPPDSIVNEMVHDVNFSKVVMDVLIQDSQINTINFSQVTSVSITDSMITDVNFSKITGTVTVAAANITGSLNFSQVNSATVTITNSMITSVDFSKVTGTVTVNIANLTGTFTAGVVNILFDPDSIAGSKIDTLSVSKLTGGTITASISLNSGGFFTVADDSIFNGPVDLNAGALVLNSLLVGALGAWLHVNSSQATFGVDVDITAFLYVSGGAQVDGGLASSGDLDIIGGHSLRIAGSVAINSSNQFVGAGVAVGSNGVGAGGFNPWNGSGYDTGGTQTFVAGGLTWTFKGGAFISAV